MRFFSSGMPPKSRDGRAVRIHIPELIPSCPSCGQEYGSIDKYGLPEVEKVLAWRLFNESKKMSDAENSVQVPSSSDCLPCFNTRRIEFSDYKNAQALREIREQDSEVEEHWTQCRIQRAKGEKPQLKRTATQSAAPPTLETEKAISGRILMKAISTLLMST